MTNSLWALEFRAFLQRKVENMYVNVCWKKNAFCIDTGNHWWNTKDTISVQNQFCFFHAQLIHIKPALSQYIWQSKNFGNGALSYDCKMEKYKNMELLQKKEKLKYEQSLDLFNN